MTDQEIYNRLDNMSQDLQKVLQNGFKDWENVNEVIAAYFSLMIGLTVHKAIDVNMSQTEFIKGVKQTWKQIIEFSEREGSVH